LYFPQADIYAYEPDPDSFKWLKKNSEGTRIKPYETAVLSREGLVSFKQDSYFSTVDLTGGLKVNAISVKKVGDGKQLDLLKMDVEGSEWDILDDVSLLQRTTDFLLVYLWDILCLI
jgi:FkbM family methyltransferase